MTNKELATVLAALRYWQQDLEANDAPPISEEFFADCEPLTSEEIDELCERLNSEPETIEPSRSLKVKKRHGARTSQPRVVRAQKVRRGKSRR